MRLADIDRDGDLDITTGWEEGGVIRVYHNPGAQTCRESWPAVTVGRVKSPEDAVFADLDGDGALDVVSSCEGRTRTMFIHWSPMERDPLLDSAAWQTSALPCTANQQMWMFALPLDVDGRNGIDLIVGSKGPDGSVGWLQSPANPRDVAAWKYHRLREAGWIMSLIAHDMDGDGDPDVVLSDRKGERRGVFWLENPGQSDIQPGNDPNERTAVWKEHAIGAFDREVMFIELVESNAGDVSILAAVKPAGILVLTSTGSQRQSWSLAEIGLPADRCGTAKAVRRLTTSHDRMSLVFTCEQANGDKEGVVLVTVPNPLPTADVVRDSDVIVDPISGSTGIKFDLIELADLDGDGDLDVITCEERENLGVIWYENPGIR